MPHCILEHSSNTLDAPDWTKTLSSIHEALMATGQFALGDIKSRVIKHEHFLIGDGSAGQCFATLNIQILDGRSDEVKTEISRACLQVLARAFAESVRQMQCSLTVQISDIHRASYSRHVAPS